MALSLYTTDYSDLSGGNFFGTLPTFTSNVTSFGEADAGTSSWQSGLLGQASGLLGQYLSGRLQIDLAKRAQAPQIASTQSPLQYDATTRATARLGGMRVGDMLPLLLVAGAAFWLLKK